MNTSNKLKVSAGIGVASILAGILLYQQSHDLSDENAPSETAISEAASQSQDPDDSNTLTSPTARPNRRVSPFKGAATLASLIHGHPWQPLIL